MTKRLRTSERVAFRRCQYQWYWHYVCGLEPRNPAPNALWFGTGIHLALQERYKYRGKKRGKNVLKVWREYCGDDRGVIYGEEYGEDREAYWDAKELGEKMLGNYLDHYGLDEEWYILSAEESVEVPIRRPLRSVNGEPGFYGGTSKVIVEYLAAFDIVGRNEALDDSLWLWDHKTAATISTDHLGLDDQAGSYWAIAAKVLARKGIVPSGTVLDGILYNFLRKAPPDSRPVNAEGLATNLPTKTHYMQALAQAGLSSIGTVPELKERADAAELVVIGDPSKRQPLPNFHREEVWRTPSEQRTQIKRIANEALHMEAVRSGTLPLLKNPTKDCRMCPFKEMCELHEQGGDWKEYRDLAFVKSDPYGDHYTK